MYLAVHENSSAACVAFEPCSRLDVVILPFVCTTERAHAYTLEVTSCNTTFGGTPDEAEHTVTFYFCEGGSYCVADFDVPLPPATSIAEAGETIEIPVDTGFVPTTAVFEKIATSWDAW